MTEISAMSRPSVSVCYVQTDTQGRSYQDGGNCITLQGRICPFYIADTIPGLFIRYTYEI